MPIGLVERKPVVRWERAVWVEQDRCGAEEGTGGSWERREGGWQETNAAMVRGGEKGRKASRLTPDGGWAVMPVFLCPAKMRLGERKRLRTHRERDTWKSEKQEGMLALNGRDYLSSDTRDQDIRSQYTEVCGWENKDIERGFRG